MPKCGDEDQEDLPMVPLPSNADAGEHEANSELSLAQMKPLAALWRHYLFSLDRVRRLTVHSDTCDKKFKQSIARQMHALKMHTKQCPDRSDVRPIYVSCDTTQLLRHGVWRFVDAVADEGDVSATKGLPPWFDLIGLHSLCFSYALRSLEEGQEVAMIAWPVEPIVVDDKPPSVASVVFVRCEPVLLSPGDDKSRVTTAAVATVLQGACATNVTGLDATLEEAASLFEAIHSRCNVYVKSVSFNLWMHLFVELLIGWVNNRSSSSSEVVDLAQCTASRRRALATWIRNQQMLGPEYPAGELHCIQCATRDAKKYRLNRNMKERKERQGVGLDEATEYSAVCLVCMHKIVLQPPRK